MIRKPTIRMSILSDPDMYPLNHPRRSSSIRDRDIKAGSLDRHFMLSPRDLFNESKLMRGNSSMTSLSTPSFRTRPEVETRGPCFMGLCLPKDFSMLFIGATNPFKPSTSSSTSTGNFKPSSASYVFVLTFTLFTHVRFCCYRELSPEWC